MLLRRKNYSKIVKKIQQNQWIHIESYRFIPNAQWFKVYEKIPISFHEPISLGKAQIDYNPMLVRVLPESGLMKLRNALLIGTPGWIETAQGMLLSGHTWYGKNTEEIKDDIEYDVEIIPGSCLTLTSDWSTVNYGHFLLDGLSRLHIFDSINPDLSTIDYIYCPTNLESSIRLINKIGLPVEKCICPQKNKALKFDVLYAPSFPGIRRVYPFWVPSFFKSKTDYPAIKPFRKIYIKRKSSRRIINEDNIISILMNHDFEIIDPISCYDPIKVFNEASVIVGAHGSGLADIVFSQKGTKLLELIPSDHIFPYWFTLANAVGMQYFYLVGKSQHERNLKQGPSPYDFCVDEGEFSYGLNHLLNIS